MFMRRSYNSSWKIGSLQIKNVFFKGGDNCVSIHKLLLVQEIFLTLDKFVIKKSPFILVNIRVRFSLLW